MYLFENHDGAVNNITVMKKFAHTLKLYFKNTSLYIDY
jgi:hypothetical protein